MARSRHLNLIFQGGGVRGIAYAGVLSKLPSSYQVHGVGGSSAGALVAALVAVGKRDRLHEILTDRGLYNLLAAESVGRQKRLFDAARSLMGLREGALRKGVAKWRALWNAQKILGEVREDLEVVWRQLGLHDSARLHTWVNAHLEGATFADVENRAHVGDLRIVATDLQSQSYRIFDTRSDPKLPVADAVLASVSIPGFFTPFLVQGRQLVDGGVLSNFPSFLFAQSEYPTIGFRLRDVPPLGRWRTLPQTPRPPVTGGLDYLFSLGRTMLEAHDKFRDSPANFKSYEILTPEHIPATKFELEDADVETLYERGELLGSDVDWEGYSALEATPSFHDPKPMEALRMSMAEGRSLRDSYYTPAQYVERLSQRTVFTARLAGDWTTHYSREVAVQVEGSRPLVLSQAAVFGVEEEGGASSVVDHYPVFEELLNEAEPRRLPIFPISSDEGMKQFLVFYTPPIAAGQPERHFRTRFSIPQEYAPTLGRGRPGRIGYVARQVATDHSAMTQFRIEIAQSLGSFSVRPSFGSNPGEPRGQLNVLDDCAYWVWQFNVNTQPVVGRLTLDVEIRPK